MNFMLGECHRCGQEHVCFYKGFRVAEAMTLESPSSFEDMEQQQCDWTRQCLHGPAGPGS